MGFCTPEPAELKKACPRFIRMEALPGNLPKGARRHDMWKKEGPESQELRFTQGEMHVLPPEAVVRDKAVGGSGAAGAGSGAVPLGMPLVRFRSSYMGVFLSFLIMPLQNSSLVF